MRGSKIRGWALAVLVMWSCASPPAAAVFTPDPYDHGFLSADGQNEVHWDPESLPVLVVVHPSAAHWLSHTERAVTQWNGVVGFGLFRFAPGVHAEAEVFTSTATPNPGVVPVLGFAEADDVPYTAHTHRVTTHTGALLVASIWLPDDAAIVDHPYAFVVVMHELGHAIGLTHDEPRPSGEQWSIMLPELRYPFSRPLPPITPADRQRVRSRYLR